MSKFDKALRIVLHHEGGVSDHAEDPGGFTVKGITLRFLRAFGLDPNNDGVIDKRDLIGLNDTQLAAIYHEKIWEPCRCDDMPQGLALAVFDAGTNLGQPCAHRLLQKALGVHVDGIVGKNTMKAIGDFALGLDGIDGLLAEYTARRGFYYATRPKVVVFGLGWFRRLIDVYRRAIDF